MANTGKTKKIEAEPIVESKTIESIAENGKPDAKNDKPFLTKKRIILAIVFTLISIGFVFVTVYPILKIDWFSYNLSVGLGIMKGTGYLWLFLILVNAFINFNRNFITILPRINKFGCKIPYREYMLYAITIAFLGAVTPSNLISDPYTMFWLKTHGVSTSKCASMFFTNTLIWQVAQILITTPIFILCCTNLTPLLADAGGKALFSAIVIGVAIDFIGLGFTIALNVSKHFHYLCARIFNGIKKKLHMKYHTKEETAQKYKERAVMKEEFKNSMKDWRTTSLIAALYVAGDILGLMAMCWSMYFVQYTIVQVGGANQLVKVNFNFGYVLMCARLSVPANRLNILPGQAMGYEAALSRLLTIYSGWSINVSLDEKTAYQVEENLVHNAVLTGKVFYSWIPAIIGIGGFIALTVQQNKLANQHKLIQNKY